MSKRSSTLPTPLVVELRPSRQLALLQVGATLLAALAVWRSGLPVVLRLALILLLGLLLLLSLRRQGWLGGVVPCRELRWDGGRWLWIGADRRSIAMRLQRAVVWRHLIVMQLGAPGGRRWLCLLSDSLDVEAMRRLRLCLRYLPVYEEVDAALPL